MFFDGLSGDSTTTPAYDKPVYDDDIFNDVQGLESLNYSKFGDAFSSVSSNSVHGAAAMNDLLIGSEFKSSKNKRSIKNDKAVQDFEDLIPGFRGGSSDERTITEEGGSFPKPASQAASKNSREYIDPFEMLSSNSSSGNTAHYFQKTSNLNKHGSTKSDVFPEMGGVSDGTDPLDDLGRITSSYSREAFRKQERSSSRNGQSTKPEQNPFDLETPPKTNVKSHGNPPHMQHGSNQTLFEMPPSVSQPPTSHSYSYEKASYDVPNIHKNISPPSEDFLESSDDVWLTVSEIPLLTLPTRAPPPSRLPPSVPVHVAREGTDILGSTHFQNSTYFSKFAPTTETSSSGHQGDPDKVFVENPLNDVTERSDSFSPGTEGENSAATAMKDAMDRAEAKFRHAKIARERDNVKAPRNREAGQFNDITMEDVEEKVLFEKNEMLECEEKQLRETEEKERARRERMHREAVEKEREKEREKARQAVERATREARDRAAIDARVRAERAAVEKANAEARVRAERAAVQRVQAEARERAAAEAKEKADKAAEKASRERATEARLRAERAAVQRVTAEARERAASEARHRAESEARDRAASEAHDRAAYQARDGATSDARDRATSDARERAPAGSQSMNQAKNENDLDSFFGSRPSSVPKVGASSVRTENPFENQSQNRNVSEAVRKSASGASGMRKAASAVNIVDDLTSIFGTVSSSFEFQEIGGESDERRLARLERHQKTQERAAKALADKNERDLQNQRDQAERHRIAETLDVEIKRWAAGKEANLRALLSTLQYVLWPECGWQPLSLTDLINASSVKKAYRRATLCIHPDKVQQKGANLQQKYIAEKVFDLLKEAWNRFNSEELF